MSDPTARIAIRTGAAPAPAHTHSQGIRSTGFVQTSGQVAADPVTGELVGLGDVVAQSRRVLANVEAVLEAGGASLADVLIMRVYLSDRKELAGLNEAYAEYFKGRIEVLPARTTIITELPREGLLVEIDALAVVSAG